jgi:hypothetical protein
LLLIASGALYRTAATLGGVTEARQAKSSKMEKVPWVDFAELEFWLRARSGPEGCDGVGCVRRGG